MPRNPVVPLVFKCEWLFSQGGVPCAVVQHFNYDTSGPAPLSIDLQVLMNDIATAWWPVVQADYPTSTLLVAMQGTDLSATDGNVGVNSINMAGTAEDSASPAQCCVMVDYQIARRYRGGHPRSYFPAPAYGAIATPSTWDAGILTDFSAAQTAVADLEGVSTSGTITLGNLVNVSYRTANDWRVDNVVDNVVGWSVSSLIRTQKRRVTASSY